VLLRLLQLCVFIVYVIIKLVVVCELRAQFHLNSISSLNLCGLMWVSRPGNAHVLAVPGSVAQKTGMEVKSRLHRPLLFLGCIVDTWKLGKIEFDLLPTKYMLLCFLCLIDSFG
jgi:hypothetical protein